MPSKTLRFLDNCWKRTVNNSALGPANCTVHCHSIEQPSYFPVSFASWPLGVRFIVYYLTQRCRDAKNFKAAFKAQGEIAAACIPSPGALSPSLSAPCIDLAFWREVLSFSGNGAQSSFAGDTSGEECPAVCNTALRRGRHEQILRSCSEKGLPFPRRIELALNWQ
jgi:hypothetical protein